jgi:hypothetical protein
VPVDRLVSDVQPSSARKPVQLCPRFVPCELPYRLVVVRQVETGTRRRALADRFPNHATTSAELSASPPCLPMSAVTKQLVAKVPAPLGRGP